jgi:hypothetical protein
MLSLPVINYIKLLYQFGFGIAKPCLSFSALACQDSPSISIPSASTGPLKPGQAADAETALAPLVGKLWRQNGQDLAVPMRLMSGQNSGLWVQPKALVPWAERHYCL